MSKRPRHECGDASCDHDHSHHRGGNSKGKAITEAESRLGEEMFGSLCSVFEGYQQQSEEQRQQEGGAEAAAAFTGAAVRQARMLFEAYMADFQTQVEIADAKRAAAAGASSSSDAAAAANDNDVASPTTDNVAAERAHNVVALCNKLNTVRKQLKNWVPYGSLAASEGLITPTKSETFDATVPTFEIDNFLYPDDDDVEALCEKGVVSRNYCLKCKATETAPTQFVSHSFSRDQLLYITCFLTPHLEAVARREDRCANAHGIQKVVDVGSRLGIVLTSFYYANASIKNIVGIELNPTLCDLQRRLLKAHRCDEARVSVVNADVLSPEGLEQLQSADVVILHNVFEWFSNEADQLAIWAKIRNALSRKGQWLIIAPRLEESLTGLAAAFDKGFSVEKFIDEWVEKVDVSEPRDAFVEERKGGLYGAEEDTMGGGCGDDEEDEEEIPEFAEQCDNIHVYRVR